MLKYTKGQMVLGFKMTNSREYFQDKYGKTRRKFVKVIITATKDDILAVDVVVNEKGLFLSPKRLRNILLHY